MTNFISCYAFCVNRGGGGVGRSRDEKHEYDYRYVLCSFLFLLYRRYMSMLLRTERYLINSNITSSVCVQPKIKIALLKR